LESILKPVIIVSILSFILGIVFDIDPVVFVSFVIAWICLMTWILTYQTGLLIKYRITGKISIGKEKILNSGTEYSLNSLDQINLSYRGYRGLRIGKNYCYGDRNSIRVIEGESVTNHDILIESKSQLTALQDILEHWYSNDYNVKETGILNRSSILLRTNLSYTEKQQEKKRLLEIKNKTVANKV
jgi:hypothetical protein